MKDKQIIIIEGPDASGKSLLCQHIKDISNGKCHIIHSNYNKSLPKANHKRQHSMIANFVAKQFSKNYYTGNNIVILDRCYISDIVYGTIGYGSNGSFDYKLKNLGRLFNKLTKHFDVKVRIIYCCGSNFNSESKEELLNDKENLKIREEYENFFRDWDFISLASKYNISIYNYDFNVDSNYSKIDKAIS